MSKMTEQVRHNYHECGGAGYLRLGSLRQLCYICLGEGHEGGPYGDDGKHSEPIGSVGNNIRGDDNGGSSTMVTVMTMMCSDVVMLAAAIAELTTRVEHLETIVASRKAKHLVIRAALVASPNASDHQSP